MNEQFISIASALDAEFVEDTSSGPMVEESTYDVATTTDALPSVSNEPVKNSQVFEEQEYIKKKLHASADMIEDVMGILKDDLRQGSKASQFEAFASLARTLNNSVNELSAYETKIKNEERFLNPDSEINNNTNTFNGDVTINMSGKDMLDMLDSEEFIQEIEAELLEDDDEVKSEEVEDNKDD